MILIKFIGILRYKRITKFRSEYNCYLTRKKKRNSSPRGFCRLSEPQSEIERKWKDNKYLDLTRELKQLWKMKVTVILIVVGALVTVPKGLDKRLDDLKIRERMDTIQTTALLKSARILTGVLGIWGDLMSHTERPQAIVGGKKTLKE